MAGSSYGLIEPDLQEVEALAEPLGDRMTASPYAVVRHCTQLGGKGTQLIIEGGGADPRTGRLPVGHLA